MTRETMDPVFRDAVRAELERVVLASTQERPHRQAAAASAPVRESRRAGLVVTAFVAIAVAVVTVFAVNLGNAATPAHQGSPAPSVSGAPVPQTSFGPIVRTIPAFPASTSVIAGASDAALYVALGSQTDDTHLTLERIDVATGAITRRSLTLEYLHQIVVGPDGVYLSTSVIKRFQDVPDTLIRIDPITLRTLAVQHLAKNAMFDGSVRVAVTTTSLVATAGDGTVQRMNPRTLAIEASRTLLTSADVSAGLFLSQPAISSGRVWVLGADHGTALVSLELSSLRTVTSTVVPKNASIPDYTTVASSADGVFAAGQRLAEVDAQGRTHVLPIGNLGTISVNPVGQSLLLSTLDDVTRLVLVDSAGTERARLSLNSIFGDLTAVGPHVVWATGVPGEAGKLTAIRISD